jgi:transposase
MEIMTSAIDHFGIIAGIFDELDIGQTIDRALPKTRQHKANHSTIIKAMVLNGVNGGIKLSSYGDIKLSSST